MGLLIAGTAGLVILAILSIMAWTWCHTYDWQDRYW